MAFFIDMLLFVLFTTLLIVLFTWVNAMNNKARQAEKAVVRSSLKANNT